MKTRCPHCKKIVIIPKDYLVSEVKCTKCGKKFIAERHKENKGIRLAIKTGIGIAVFFSILLAFYALAGLREKPFKPYGDRKNQVTQRKQDMPVVSDITFEEVDTVYDRLDLSDCKTDLQKDKRRKQFEQMIKRKYIGNLVQWTGQVADVDRTIIDKRLYVKFKHTEQSLISDVTVYFTDSQKNKLLKLEKGDKVTYQGRIHRICVLFNHELANGKIVKIHYIRE